MYNLHLIQFKAEYQLLMSMIRQSAVKKHSKRPEIHENCSQTLKPKIKETHEKPMNARKFTFTCKNK